MDYLIGLDIGTTAIDICTVSTHAGTGKVAYCLPHPRTQRDSDPLDNLHVSRGANHIPLPPQQQSNRYTLCR